MAEDTTPAPETAALPPGLAAAPTARALVLALRRRWPVALVCAVVGAVSVAASVYFLLPAPKFMAQSLLHVEATPPSVVSQRGETRADFQNYQRTQVALVKSRLVLNAALRDPEVAALGLVRDPIDPIGWLQKELVVDFNTAPEILRIALLGENSAEMKVIVAKITRAYLDEIVKREDGKRRDRLDKLKDVHERYQETLRTKRRTLRELVENVGSGDAQTIALKQRFAQEQLALTEKELLQIDSELRKIQTDITLQQERGAPAEGFKYTDAELDELARKDPGMERLLARKSQLQQELAEVLRVAVRGEEEPRVKQIRREITDADKAVTTLREQLRPDLAGQLQLQLERAYRTNVASMTDRRSLLQELRKSLVKEQERLTTEVRQLNKGSLDIESYKQDIAQAEETAKKVAGELETLAVELKATQRVTELESAFVTQPDDARRRMLMTAGGAFGALVLAARAVACWEFRARRIQSAGEVVQGLGIKLVGTVPMNDAPGSAAALASQGQTMDGMDVFQTETLDTIRAMLLHTARQQALQVVMVTSAVSGEGKTSLSTRLAASLARAGRMTLLVDADLRKPSIHKLFGIDQGPGLSEGVLQTVPLGESIHSSGIAGLSLLPAGVNTGPALEALAQENMTDIMEALRMHYDFIIIDTAPVLPVADALLLGPQIDGVLLSVMLDHSQMHKVHAAHQLLNEVNIPVLGAVVNGVPSQIYAPDYRYVRRQRPGVREPQPVEAA